MIILKASDFIVIITFILLIVVSSPLQNMEKDNNDIHNLQDLAKNESNKYKKYQYLFPSQKINPGFFKSYQFDLRFPEIKGTKIDKNLFQGAFEYLSFKFTHKTEGKRNPQTKQDFEFIEKELPMMKVDFTEQTQKDIRFTWIGHSTAVIQIGPDNFIIDPIFKQKKVSKRYRPPPCTIKQLPKIDVVMISHDHYDHFDEQSIKELESQFSPIFMAGIGTQDILPQKSSMKLMDWMDQVTLKLKGGQYKITFVPASHWARRWIADLNTRLWGGFIIDTPFGQRIYYSGDTGYCGVFKQIGEKYGPFDLSILPIGAYQPREWLKPQHINPQEAVKIHKEIKSRQSVGVHWGTLSMGRQGFAQPKYDLQKAVQQQGLSKDEFITIKHGESKIFKNNVDL